VLFRSPAFNEEATITRVVLLAQRYVDQVFVCNDGSTDMTGHVAEALGAVVILHEVNLGYEAALMSLFKEVGKRAVDVAVTLDADGQDDPSEIPKLLDRLNVGDVDIVIGARSMEGGNLVPEERESGLEIAGMGVDGSLKITDVQSGFRAYTRRALESLIPTEEGMGVSVGILLKAGEKGFRIAEVPTHGNYDETPQAQIPPTQIPSTQIPSTQTPAPKGLDSVPTTLDRLSIKNPVLFYGVPSLIVSAVALVLWLWMLQIFDASREINPDFALIASAASTIGLLLLLVSIAFWVINSVVHSRRLRDSIRMEPP
jgi:glycosyltransferase involved in cell wall biosynthesis